MLEAADDCPHGRGRRSVVRFFRPGPRGKRARYAPRPMGACAIVDPNQLPVYDLGQHHPFARDRLLALWDLLQKSRLVTDQDLLPVAPATDAQLHMAHDPRYIEAVRALSSHNPGPEWLRAAPRFGLGTDDNPIAPGQHEAARAV